MHILTGGGIHADMHVALGLLLRHLLGHLFVLMRSRLIHVGIPTTNMPGAKRRVRDPTYTYNTSNNRDIFRTFPSTCSAQPRAHVYPVLLLCGDPIFTKQIIAAASRPARGANLHMNAK